MMIISFLTSCMTKVTSTLSERSWACYRCGAESVTIAAGNCQISVQHLGESLNDLEASQTNVCPSQMWPRRNDGMLHLRANLIQNLRPAPWNPAWNVCQCGDRAIYPMIRWIRVETHLEPTGRKEGVEQLQSSQCKHRSFSGVFMKVCLFRMWRVQAVYVQ